MGEAKSSKTDFVRIEGGVPTGAPTFVRRLSACEAPSLMNISRVALLLFFVFVLSMGAGTASAYASQPSEPSDCVGSDSQCSVYRDAALPVSGDSANLDSESESASLPSKASATGEKAQNQDEDTSQNREGELVARLGEDGNLFIYVLNPDENSESSATGGRPKDENSVNKDEALDGERQAEDGSKLDGSRSDAGNVKGGVQIDDDNDEGVRQQGDGEDDVLDGGLHGFAVQKGDWETAQVLDSESEPRADDELDDSVLAYWDGTSFVFDKDQKTGEGEAVDADAPRDSNGGDGYVAYYSLGNGGYGRGWLAPWFWDRAKIASVSFGEGVSPDTMANWFYGLFSLSAINFTNLDTSNVVDMQGLFSGCTSLTKLDLSGFNTSRVTNMSRMFSNCCNITSLDLSSFDTSNVKSLAGMFSGCTSLSSLDVSSFTASQLKTAAIPVNNAGGFWRLNVPTGYDIGIKLREPTAQERAEAGLPSDPGGSGGETGDNDATGSGVIAASSALLAYVLVNQYASTLDEEALVDNEVSSGQKNGLTNRVLEAINLLLSESVIESSIDSAAGLVGSVNAATSALEALGLTGAMSKTMALVIAACGMLVAAGLILALCLKIR